MKKINIIRKNEDFRNIIFNNKPFKYKDYIIYINKTDEQIYHFGISISKKICNAVGRNKIKRQLKDIIDKNIYEKNINCIIIVRKSILDRNYNEMEENLNKAFHILKIIKEK